jgi:hypothetical protein
VFAPRLLWTASLVLAVGLLASCGGQGSADSGAPAGTPQNPLVGKMIAEDEPETGPSAVLDPCDLLTSSAPNARAELPFSLQRAPQGPTCLIRPKGGQSESLMTLSVQSADFARLRSQLRQARAVTVSHRTAYCGQFGQAMLYLPLASHRVLSIAGPCPLAKQFALTAVERLEG